MTSQPAIPTSSSAWRTIPQNEFETEQEQERSPERSESLFSLGFVVVGAVPSMFFIAWIRGAFPSAPYIERSVLNALFLVAIALILFAQFKRKPWLKRMAIQIFFAASGGLLYWDIAMWLHSLSKKP